MLRAKQGAAANTGGDDGGDGNDGGDGGAPGVFVTAGDTGLSIIILCDTLVQ